MPRELIGKLISQHNLLRVSLAKIKDATLKNQPDFQVIAENLNKFFSFLGEHLDLENNKFYPLVFEKIKGDERAAKDIQNFKNEMDEIAEDVKIFVKDFEDEDKIKNDFNGFKKDLDFIISSLSIRVSSEEKGIFLLI
jgi:hemerythrin-like domain-containing protein